MRFYLSRPSLTRKSMALSFAHRSCLDAKSKQIEGQEDVSVLPVDEDPEVSVRHRVPSRQTRRRHFAATLSRRIMLLQHCVTAA